MKKLSTRRHFAPYASRKNMKRALGKGKFTAPRTETLGGMGSQLLNSMLGTIQKPDQSGASRGK